MPTCFFLEFYRLFPRHLYKQVGIIKTGQYTGAMMVHIYFARGHGKMNGQIPLAVSYCFIEDHKKGQFAAFIDQPNGTPVNKTMVGMIFKTKYILVLL